MASSFYGKFRASRTGRLTSWTVANRNRILLSGAALYFLGGYLVARRQAYKRDFIHNKSFLVWRIHDGSIVEQRSPGSALNYLLTSNSPADEPPRVLTLFEALRTLKFIEHDDRIAGIIADFTITGVPSVPSYHLGLAQIEELHDAILSVKQTRNKFLADSSEETTDNAIEAMINLEPVPPEPFRTIAIADTFQSQGDFALATAFDEIYVQPMGDVPLTGLSATIPFWSRLLAWAGIKVHAEARTKWKSMVAPFTLEELSPEQKANEIELLNGLNDNLCTLIARGRYPTDEPAVALQKVKDLSQRGPFSAVEAKELGLINDTLYKHQIIKSIVDEEPSTTEESLISFGTSDNARLHGFYHYSKTITKLVDDSDSVLDVGVVYLLGTIGEAGEFSTSTVIRGLKEAADDEEINAIVLRIDSGGGGVVDSDSIWAAVEHAKSKGKTVVASFGNAAASGGYLVATHADAILADASTITGSIGVASLRPTVTQTFLDRIKVTVESFFMGSKSQSLFHELEGEALDRHRAHIDATYDTFKGLVCSGRQISTDIIEDVAGGRVLTGLKAFCQSGPPGMKEILAKRQNYLGGDSQDTTEALAEYALVSRMAEGENTVQLDPDQATSPFAIPIPPSEDPPRATEDTTADEKPSTTLQGFTVQPDGSAILAVPREKVEKLLNHKRRWGRGLVDGLGSIHDAAVMAGELGLARAIADIQAEKPETTEAQALAQLMPGVEIDYTEDGDVHTQMDISLKVFPRPKGIWEVAKERARNGDAIDPAMVSILYACKLAVAAFVLQAAQRTLSEELSALGLNTLKQATSKQRVAQYNGLGMHFTL